MITAPIDNIEDGKPRLYNCLSSFADHITVLLHYYSIKLKFFILNIISISMISNIVAAFVPSILRRKLQLYASSPTMLMLSIKNAMSFAATVFATDYIDRMMMDAVQKVVKKNLIVFMKLLFMALLAFISWMVHCKISLTKMVSYKIHQ